MKLRPCFILLYGIYAVLLFVYMHKSIVQAQTVRTNHFIIYNNTLDSSLTNDFLRVMEDRLARYYPAPVLSRPIDVYIENNQQSMRRAIGSGSPGFTTPTGSIYVRRDVSNIMDVASHELSHAVCVQLCPAEWPPWLTEGLAMLSEGIAKRNVADWRVWIREGADTLAKDSGDNWFKYIKQNGRHYDPQVLLGMRAAPVHGEEQKAFYADATALVYFLLEQRITRYKDAHFSPHELISTFFKDARRSPRDMNDALARYFDIQGGVAGLSRSFREWEEKNIFSTNRKPVAPHPIPPERKEMNAAHAARLIQELEKKQKDKRR